MRGWNHHQPADEFTVDVNIKDAKADNFHGLLLPGGVVNPDALRLIPEAISFIKQFVDAKKPIAAICHGPWTLINAGGVKGRKLTSWPSLQIDLSNAGAQWVDQEMVQDDNLITSRKPDDIPAFNKAFINLLANR